MTQIADRRVGFGWQRGLEGAGEINLRSVQGPRGSSAPRCRNDG